MNAFTRSFMQQPFICDLHSVTTGDDRDLIHNEIPVVEIPGLDTSLLIELEHRARSRPDLFLDTIHANKNKDWWCRPTSNGWTSMTIVPLDTRSTKYHDESHITHEAKAVSTSDPICKDLAVEIFKSVGLSVTQLHILKLEPDGWLQPHIDTFVDPVGLDYFWIPLHDFPVCLKVWPWGWLDHKFGNMYLLNYSRWVHAAHNSTDRDRLILNGRLDLVSLPNCFKSTFSRQSKSWKKLWKHEP